MQRQPESGLQPKLVRHALLVLGLLIFAPMALAVVAAAFVYPSWQIVVSATSMVAAVGAVAMTDLTRTRLGGATARQHARTAAWAFLALGLITLAGVMLSVSPVD